MHLPSSLPALVSPAYRFSPSHGRRPCRRSHARVARVATTPWCLANRSPTDTQTRGAGPTGVHQQPTRTGTKPAARPGPRNRPRVGTIFRSRVWLVASPSDSRGAWNLTTPVRSDPIFAGFDCMGLHGDRSTLRQLVWRRPANGCGHQYALGSRPSAGGKDWNSSDYRVVVGRSVLISGASIAGPALAYWLRRFGMEPVVVERAQVLRPGGQTVECVARVARL